MANKNEHTYETVVQRMRHTTDQGVRFKVCGLALHGFGATLADMRPFLDVTPSAMTELVH
ncbi:MAG: DsrE family protein [Hydrogenophaga sp.]|uniref:DsrE family protein n=1 Tax=Hydrogenophaga sp. TaxID=1904254 RepID=UPI001BC4669A|nr:DsrE family protein [Hydrogenophaga sp.]MBS3910885.1 DsrE family protein [Hydrogenophaga sp.]MDO9146339.1 DsrE family protein [Hydrogenophaga sp.]MDO9604650.1 DsrE family protein [Hydrogenophaga sp.]